MIDAIDVAVNPFFPQFAPRFSRFGYWRFLGGEWTRRARAGWKVDGLLSSMDRGRIAMAGLVALWATSPRNGSDCFVTGDELAPLIRRHRSRFFGIVGVDPRLPRDHAFFAPRYIERAVRKLGFKGVHLALPWLGLGPADKRLYPVYAKCIELDVPVVIPLGLAPPRSGARTVAEPVLLDPVIGDMPELRIVGTRIGYPWERESVFLARNNPNFNIAADWPAPRCWGADFLNFIQQGRFPKYDAGSDQVMWGSDFPMQEPHISRGELERLGFSDLITRQVLHDNAVRVFKL